MDGNFWGWKMEGNNETIKKALAGIRADKDRGAQIVTMSVLESLSYSDVLSNIFIGYLSLRQKIEIMKQIVPDHDEISWCVSCKSVPALGPLSPDWCIFCYDANVNMNIIINKCETPDITLEENEICVHVWLDQAGVHPFGLHRDVFGKKHFKISLESDLVNKLQLK